MTIPRSKFSEMSVQDVQAWFALGLKHLRLVVLLMCFASSLGLAFYVFKRPVYGARAHFRIKTEGRVLSQEDFFQDTSFFTILQKISKPYMVERIAARFGIEADYQTIRRRHFKKIRARKLPYSGQPGEKGVEVRVYAYSKDLAVQWLDRAFEVYYDEQARRRRDDRLKTIRDCQEEMDRMQAEMRAYTAKQEVFRERTDWDKICAEWNEYEGVPKRLKKVERRLDELRALRALLAADHLTTVERLSILASKQVFQAGPELGQMFSQTPDFVATRPVPLPGDEIGNADVPPVDAQTGLLEERQPLDSPPTDEFVVIPGMEAGPISGWEVFYQEKLILEKERANLGETYLSGHPKMRALVERLEEVESGLKDRYEAAIARLDWESFIYRQEEQELRRKLPRVEQVRLRYNAVMEQFIQLKYGKLPWGTKYSELLEKMSIAKMELDYGTAAPEEHQIEFLGYVKTPDLPVSPHRAKLMLACLFLGLVLSTAAVFVLEFMDRTVVLLESAESDLGLRGLGIVPLVPAVALPAECRLLTDGVVRTETHQRSLVETFRNIRANLMVNSQSGDNRQVIMVTSSLPREGKSAVSTNLSIALARSGKRVLLIDADARRGRLQGVLGAKGPGLVDVLSEGGDMESACRPTREENLDLMGSGRSGSKLPELLAGNRFADGLQALRLKYDHIIVDTPPVLGLSEATDLLPAVDGVLLVIWAKYTPISEVRASVSLLRANNANFCGFVLNRVDLTNSAYYYRYYYYRYYYYSDYYRRGYETKELPEHPIGTAEA